jgi:hypothetical protein
VRPPQVVRAWLPWVEFWVHDVLGDPEPVRARLAAMPGPLLLICDNGDKPRELALYAPGLRVGDCIVTHDYAEEGAAGEVWHADVPPALWGPQWRPVWHAEARAMGSSYRIWLRIGAPS